MTTKYRASSPLFRQLMDRPRFYDWIEYELQHIKSQDESFDMELEDFKLDALEWSYYHDACLKSGSHEIVELLSRMADVLPLKYHRYLHRYLTSSNVIDSCNHYRWVSFLSLYVKMYGELRKYVSDTGNTSISGYTHGKLAVHTSFRNRLGSAIHVSYNTVYNYYSCAALGGVPHVGPVGASTQRQCWPRHDYFKLWVSLLTGSAGLSQLALDYRFYAADFFQDISLVMSGTTSSAMPNKNNPSDFERINSLDLLIRGIVCSLLQTPPQWLDRDLVHSALERETIDNLWEYVFYQLEETIRLVKETQVLIKDPQPVNNSFSIMNDLLDQGMSWHEARKVAKEKTT